MLKKYLKIILSVAAIMLPQIVLAADSALQKLEKVGSTGGPYSAATDASLSTYIGIIISALLGLIGTIFLVLMLYAGYNWMIARGEEEKVEKAKDTITRAIIGLIIVVGAYAIWSFIFNQLIL